ncbi:uncharacterized protein [Magallana gigas]|uniref:uncharacterized protein isoform X1 n=1 Tax=Magallana gigas TaxID=29159 RepID=UPI0033405179
MARVYDILRIVFIYKSVSIGILQSTCRPPGPDGIPHCCPFYFLTNNTCEECPPGYSYPANDINCSLPCGYPSYGARCEGRCNCSNEDCHHVYGCPVTTTIKKEPSFEMKSFNATQNKMTTKESVDHHTNLEKAYIRRYVIGVGLVLVAIMVIINIFNIHTYRRRNRETKETIHPVI